MFIQHQKSIRGFENASKGGTDMTSREIVKRAVRFQDPPRIPYNFDSNRTENGITYGEDMER